VYEQSAQDLEFAAANLKDIGQVDESRITKLAASHALTEVYISLERWQNAIDEASKVIDHPETALMTERFGARVNDPVFGGDVYWDLFRHGNQNRASSGNTESIWILQNGYNMPGGGDYIRPMRDLPYTLERVISPNLSQANIFQSDGSTETVLPFHNTFVAGPGAGFSAPSPYFQNELWEKSGFDQDIRNSEHNIIRDVQVRNPNNEYNGQWVIADNLPLRRQIAEDTTRYFYPFIGKALTPGLHPEEYWHQNQTVPGSLRSGAIRTFRDHYEMRLAETFLLRAEAYLGNGDKTNAAMDINMVRSRAQAPEVSADEVDIDYILDERLRELYYEELRLVTLCRLGKAVDRVKRLNPIVGASMDDHQNLFPIPLSEIQENVEAVLEQNPWY